MKRKSTRWIALWLILVSAALLIRVSYAAYTRAEYVKRVAATKNESTSFLFSSNYLYLRESSSTEYPLRMIPVSTQADVDLTITVCNYLQSDITRANDTAIPYTFRAQLVDADGNPLSDEKRTEFARFISISGTTPDGKGAYTAPATLDGGTATTHFYEIKCQQQYAQRLDEISIQIEAVPNGGSQGKLVALLRLSSGSRSETPWSGRFVEVTKDTTLLDAFNYVISGTAKTTVRISWNPNRVTLSPWSLKLLGNPALQQSDENRKYIEVSVGEADTSYTLQFYRVNGIPSGETDAMVKAYVSFDEIQTTNG